MGVLTTVAKKSSGQNSLTSATWSTAFGALVGFSTRWYTRKIEMGEFPWLGQKFALIDIQINNYSILGRTTELKLLVVKLTDQFFSTSQWMERFPKTSLCGLPQPVSDPFPLLLQVDLSIDGPTPLRFENMWLRHTSFKISKIGGVRRFMLDGSVLSFKQT